MTHSKPLVTVIVPVWNGEKTISACLDSILSQSWEAMQIIVVNDGSTDRTAGILQEYAAKDSRIQPITQPNGGVAAARNNAITHAQGKWIRFVDADDELPPDSIRILVETAEHEGTDMMLSGFTGVLNGIAKDHCMLKKQKTMTVDAFMPLLNRYANTFYMGVLWNKLFRTELVHGQNCRFQSGLAWGEDFMFVCDYLKKASQLTVIPLSTYRYYRNPNGMTAKQVLLCFRHPLKMIKMKLDLYHAERSLFIARGCYARYRSSLWLYLFRITLQN